MGIGMVRGVAGALPPVPSAADVEAVLRFGDEVQGTATILDGSGANFNGAIPKYTLRGDGVTAPALDVAAVVKTARSQPAQEAFMWRLAKVLGIEHLYPAAAMRANGESVVQMVAGKVAEEAKVTTYAQLEDVVTRAYMRRTPGIDEASARHAAKIDLELVAALDFVVANSDRHLKNVLVDTEGVTLEGAKFIDAGLLGTPGLSHRAPQLKPHFMPDGGKGLVQLHPETVERLRALTPDELTAAHAQLKADMATVPKADYQGDTRQADLDRSLRSMVPGRHTHKDMQNRLRDAITTGQLRYHPDERIHNPSVLADVALRNPGIALQMAARDFPIPTAIAATVGLGGATTAGVLGVQALRED